MLKGPPYSIWQMLGIFVYDDFTNHPWTGEKKGTGLRDVTAMRKLLC
jgi:hypothetical protein